MKNILKFFKILVLLIIPTISGGCDKWDETADVSHVTYLPEFEFIGGQFMSFIKSDQKFTDPGVKARSNGTDLNVFFMNPDDIPDSLNEPGVYVIRYYAENAEGFSKTAERIIAVTYSDVSNNNLSGTYATSIFGATVESTVTRIDEKGLYKCTEVLGFPGAEVPGRIVDIGENKLALLPGEGFFGNYDISEGSYTKNSLSWSVILLDEPNTGITINVSWIKTE